MNKEKLEIYNEELEKDKNKIKEFLKQVAKSTCSHCYGQGHRGYNIITKQFVICQCVRKNYKKYMELVELDKQRQEKELIDKTLKKSDKKETFFQKVLHKILPTK